MRDGMECPLFFGVEKVDTILLSWKATQWNGSSVHDVCKASDFNYLDFFVILWPAKEQKHALNLFKIIFTVRILGKKE